MRKLFTVTQPRTRTVIFERKIWAESPEAAIQEAEQAMLWPETYDKGTITVEKGEWVAEQITDPRMLEVWEEPCNGTYTDFQGADRVCFTSEGCGLAGCPSKPEK